MFVRSLALWSINCYNNFQSFRIYLRAEAPPRHNRTLSSVSSSGRRTSNNFSFPSFPKETTTWTKPWSSPTNVKYPHTTIYHIPHLLAHLLQ